MLKIIKIFLIAIIFTTAKADFAIEKQEGIEKIRQAIVTINSRVSLCAYENNGTWSGTGFIVDLEKGFLVTNAHVVGRACSGTYFITFYNGQQAEAKVTYYDMYADFAILKIDPQELPKQIEKIEFTDKSPSLGDKVFIVGNNEDQGFSFHSGHLSDLFDIRGNMPQGSYIVSLNVAGGSSGSPLLNSDNKAIGVNYGGAQTYALALKSSYVTDVLNAFKNNQPPQRKHIGIISALYSLDKAVKHRHFPKGEMEAYVRKFPDVRNRVIIVKSVIAGSAAKEVLMPGDIIWTVNNKELGGDLTVFDRAMNNSNTDNINLTIFRDGKKLEVKVPLYDLEKHKIQKMLDFAGAIFFEVDDYSASMSGAPIGKIAIANVQTGSSFSEIYEAYTQDYKNIYRLVLKSLNGKKVENLEDLIRAANEAIKQKFVNIDYKNYQPYYPYFDAVKGFISNHENLTQDITFDSIETKPRLLRYDNKTNEWVSEEVK